MSVLVCRCHKSSPYDRKDQGALQAKLQDLRDVYAVLPTTRLVPTASFPAPFSGHRYISSAGLTLPSRHAPSPATYAPLVRLPYTSITSPSASMPSNDPSSYAGMVSRLDLVTLYAPYLKLLLAMSSTPTHTYSTLPPQILQRVSQLHVSHTHIQPLLDAEPYSSRSEVDQSAAVAGADSVEVLMCDDIQDFDD